MVAVAVAVMSAVSGYALKRGDIDVAVLDVVSGLSSNKINSIAQDEIGYLWFATDNGLCRYDGFDFMVYKPTEMLRGVNVSNNIIRVVAQKDGKLWLSTPYELMLFNSYTRSIELSVSTREFSGQIKDMAVMRGSGELYLATTVGLYRLDGDVPVRLSDGYIFSLFEDREGFLWVGEWQGDFFRYDTRTGEIFPYSNYFHTGRINVSGFTQDSEGRIWVATWNSYGILRLDDPYNTTIDNVKHFPLKDQEGYLLNDVLYDIKYMEDKDEIWVGLGDNLMVLSDLEKEDGFVAVQGLEFYSRENYRIFQDRSGVVWVSSWGFGLNKVVRKNDYFAPPYRIEEKFGKKIITALYEDSEGIIWVGSRLDMLCLWNKKTGQVTSYKDIEGLRDLTLRSNAVLDVYETHRGGDVWLVTRYDGVFVLKREEGKVQRLIRLRDTDGDSPYSVTQIKSMEGGRLLFASSAGIYEINADTYTEGDSLTPLWQDVLEGEAVQVVEVDSNGDIWLGTKSMGVIRFDSSGRHYIYSTENNRINENQVLTILQDSKLRLWVGTQGGGLSRYNESSDSFESLDRLSAISNAAVTSIIEDKLAGNLWLGTDRGLACLSLDSDITVSVYTQSDGLLNFQYSDGAVLQLSCSELLFGGYSGMDVFMPRNTKAKAPRAVISDVTVRGRTIKHLVDRGEIDGDDVDFQNKSISLNYDQNFIAFSFSAISYDASHTTRFSYRMLGVEDGWNYVGYKNHQITYGNMPSGRYRFEVRACQQNSEWSESVYMDIEILSHWSLRWWAFLIYIVFGLLILYIVMRIARRELRMKNSLRIERIERQKTVEVNQVKLQFFANISHELFTPLSVMQYSVDSFKGIEGVSPHTLDILENNLTRLKRLLRQLMEFRKAENKNLKLLVSSGDIVSFVRNLCECNFKPLFEAKAIRLDFSAEDEIMLGYFDPDKLDKMLCNLISNALKYNFRGGYVSISLSWGELSGLRAFVIKVTNSGEGISEDRITHIFERFYEGDYRRFKTTGTGIGLSLTRDLVQLHEGEIAVESVVGESTTFRVALPALSEAYSEEVVDNRPKIVESLEEETFEVAEVAEALVAEEAAETVQAAETLEKAEEVAPAAEEVVELIEDTANREDILLEATERVILLVEDDTDILYLLSGLFSRYFRVLTATNGQEALDILSEEENVEVVVADNLMPVMDGCELVRRMRASEDFESMPVVMLSAKREVADKLDGLRAGADAYLSKPLEFDLLLAQVDVLLKRKKKFLELYMSSRSVVPSSDVSLSEVSSEGESDASGSEVCEADLSSMDKVFLDKVISIVEERMENIDFSVEDLSESMNMAQATLYRKLKSLVGVSISEFIRDLRLKRAEELLKSHSYRVNDVAYMVGFSDPKYFSKVFKKIKGITPANFQKEN